MSQAVGPATREGGRAVGTCPPANGTGRTSTLRSDILLETAEVLTIPFLFQILFGDESQGG